MRDLVWSVRVTGATDVHQESIHAGGTLASDGVAANAQSHQVLSFVGSVAVRSLIVTYSGQHYIGGRSVHALRTVVGEVGHTSDQISGLFAVLVQNVFGLRIVTRVSSREEQFVGAQVGG